MTVMNQLPEDVRSLLLQHPNLQLIKGNKVRCALTGHELPCRLPELQDFTGGKKYKRLTKVSGAFDFSSFQPHVVPSTKNPHQMFCKLTLRHINKIPEHVQKHVRGRRYGKALLTYDECKKQGVEYVPACLLRRNKQKRSGGERPAGKKGDAWEPSISNSEASDSEDSMSDLYPAEIFSEKSPGNKQDGGVKPGGDDYEEEAMEVESQATQSKRQQRQNGPPQKKFKTRHQKSKHFKKAAK